MPIQTIDAATYASEKAIADKARAYWETNATFTRGGWSSLSAELASHPDYAACDNAMRGRIEQYEVLSDVPAALTAYIGSQEPNGMGIDREYGRTYPLTVWTGLPIGYATLGRPYYIRGTKVHRVYAWIRGKDGVEREFTGVGQGVGMMVNLRETAASKRNRKVESVA